MTMPSPKISDDIASLAEVQAAFVGLHLEDLQKLKQIARIRSHGLPTSNWEDLLQEALFRTLSGARQWPRTVPFTAFLAQTMRSIASDERKRALDAPMVMESDIGTEGGPAMDLSDIAVTTVTPESQAAAKSALAEIEAIFSGDSEALHVLEGLALGATPSEVQATSKMSPTQYATAQRRIQRALAKRFGKD